MRIIAGIAKSRPIKAPKGMDTRPTLDRVRETIFNMLQEDVQGSRVLDLYAGSGALGLEAVSRGAEHAWLIDQSRNAQTVIGDNIRSLRFEDKCTLLSMSDKAAVKKLQGQLFHLIFLDPPYRMDTTETVQEMLENGLIGEETVLVIEYSENKPDIEEKFERYKHRDFGEIQVAFYRLKKEMSK